jgi:hypothetical protein
MNTLGFKLTVAAVVFTTLIIVPIWAASKMPKEYTTAPQNVEKCKEGK